MPVEKNYDNLFKSISVGSRLVDLAIKIGLLICVSIFCVTIYGRISGTMDKIDYLISVSVPKLIDRTDDLETRANYTLSQTNIVLSEIQTILNHMPMPIS